MADRIRAGRGSAMASDVGNPAQPWGLRLFSVAVILVLVVGSGLFLTPGLVTPRWAWPLLPFNARFLGSFYIAEMVAMAAMLFWNRWSPARLVLAMAFVFTAVVSAVSLAHLEVFNFGRKSPWIWFVVYIGSAGVSALFLWRGRLTLPVASAISGLGWARWLRVEAVLLAVYGAGLLLLPSLFGAFWPWAIDTFHAQTYSAIFITGAAGAWLLAGRAPREELLTLGAAQVALGLLPIAGLVITDAAAKRVDWSAPGTWAWVALFALIAMAGAVKLRAAKRRKG